MSERAYGPANKLTAELADTIISAVSSGVNYRDAFHSAGIVESTGYRWLQTAEEPTPERSQYARKADHEKAYRRWLLCRKLREGITKAEADAKLEALSRIQKAGRSGIWTADAWYLERKYPAEFARRITELTGPEGGPIVVADEARGRIAELLERLSAPDAEAIAGNGGQTAG